jgi:DNA adenine methylase
MPESPDHPLARPFLKWAGGKGQLLNQLEAYFPPQLKSGDLGRYVEPFVGSGAVFFRIYQKYPLLKCLLTDINPELILVYRTVKHDVEGLIEKLAEIETRYLALNEEKRSEFYYQIRKKFNDQRHSIQYEGYESSWIQRAAFTIFLNRTGYNGLFRLNSKGEYNVPVGRYKNPRILDANNLRSVSRLLSEVSIHFCDYEEVAGFVDDKTLVYFDPPYRPLSSTARFTSYSKDIFDDRQQLRLATFYRCLDAKGGKLMLSNSDPHNHDPEDDFFERAYAGYQIVRLSAMRNINRDPRKRGPLSELLIMNYD